MKSYQVIRIAVLLAVIFVAGLVTGRVTAPKPRTLVFDAAGRVTTSDAVLARLTARLGLDPDQQRKFAPLLEEQAGDLARHPPGTPERLQAFQRYVPRMATLLRPEQKPAFDRSVREVEARFEQAIRNRNRRVGVTNSNAGLPAPATNR